MKTVIRDMIPARLQVPIKYGLNALLGHLEDELGLLRWLIQPGDRVIDVGGNRGIYLYCLWRLGALVEVFEPNPACARVLAAWARGKDRVFVHGVALSDQAGDATLHIPRDNNGVEHDASASLEHADFTKSRDVRVQLRTLDSCGFRAIRLIKIDVEGHEASVLRGAEQTLRNSNPALLIEIEQRHNPHDIHEIFNQLAEWGYEGYFLDQGQLRPLSDFVLARDQNPFNFGTAKSRYINNFLFLAKDRLENGEYPSLPISTRA